VVLLSQGRRRLLHREGWLNNRLGLLIPTPDVWTKMKEVIAISTRKTSRTPEELQTDRMDSLEALDLLNSIERFLSGPVFADQDSVMKRLEPLRWELALMLDSNTNRNDEEDVPLRWLMCRLELEALLNHPDVIVETARILHAKLQRYAPEFLS
jgi:hypothetical protein